MELRFAGFDEYQEFQRELAALKRDAERYRWLRSHAVDERYHGDKFIYFACDFENWNDVDAAIDAAMKESK